MNLMFFPSPDSMKKRDKFPTKLNSCLARYTYQIIYNLYAAACITWFTFQKMADMRCENICRSEQMKGLRNFIIEP